MVADYAHSDSEHNQDILENILNVSMASEALLWILGFKSLMPIELAKFRGIPHPFPDSVQPMFPLPPPEINCSEDNCVCVDECV